jgi:N-acetyl-anhydromuramyl-L-alanine amidase AmpD
MTDTVDKRKYFHIRRKQNKTQIILTHTSRSVRYYLMALKYRFGGKYEKVPHFVISKEGNRKQFFESKYSSNYMDMKRVDNKSIIISLENNGWLKKHHISGKFMNWIGDIYFNKPFEKKWRGYGFWDPYTEEQYIELSKLIKELTEEFGIEMDYVGHNTKVSGVENFKGITSKSNYSDLYTGVSPAFDFDKLIEMTNEKND